MTSKQRAYLMSLASNLNPIFQVGKSSLTPELTAAIGESFNNNELIDRKSTRLNSSHRN